MPRERGSIHGSAALLLGTWLTHCPRMRQEISTSSATPQAHSMDRRVRGRLCILEEVPCHGSAAVTRPRGPSNIGKANALSAEAAETIHRRLHVRRPRWADKAGGEEAFPQGVMQRECAMDMPTRHSCPCAQGHVSLSGSGE